MLTRLLENWPYKLAAVAIAIVLRLYVSGLNDPHTTKQINNIAVNLSHVPDALVVSDSTSDVSVQVSGAASSLDDLSASSFVANVDLRNARSGVNSSLPLRITSTTPLPSDVNIETQSPHDASVTMEAKRTERLPIHVSFRRVAPAGFSYGAPVVMPSVATVEGAESAVDRVADLVIVADDAVGGETSNHGILDGVGTIVALTAQQEPIGSVTILPQQAEVKVPIQNETATKDLIVNASVAGTPAFPAQVTSVDVQPARVSVMGAPITLAQASVVDTAPVDVTGATGDVRKVVAVNLPNGLTSTKPLTVIVTVHIKPIQAGSPAQKPV